MAFKNDEFKAEGEGHDHNNKKVQFSIDFNFKESYPCELKLDSVSGSFEYDIPELTVNSSTGEISADYYDDEHETDN